MAGIFVAFALSSCASSSSAPEITGSQAPAPGSQEGIRSITDTDYEQIALAVDTAQIELSRMAKEPARNASAAVQAVSTEALAVLPQESAVLRKSLVNNGDAETAPHNHAAVDDAAISALNTKSGKAFDSAWARDMLVLNEQVIAAAVNEMNLGEDRRTRAMARSKIDYASKQNATLKRIAAVG